MGDELLRAFARMISKELREVDGLYRYGGEEFVVVLPETGPQASLVAANRLRQRVEARVLKSRTTPEISIRITASFGVSGLR